MIDLGLKQIEKMYISKFIHPDPHANQYLEWVC